MTKELVGMKLMHEFAQAQNIELGSVEIRYTAKDAQGHEYGVREVVGQHVHTFQLESRHKGEGIVENPFDTIRQLKEKLADAVTKFVVLSVAIEAGDRIDPKMLDEWADQLRVPRETSFSNVHVVKG